MSQTPFADIKTLAQNFRNNFETANAKKFTLLYAYNGTGKTRLSTAFKDIGKMAGQPDTLYYNAFTEDLFSWDNDLDRDNERYLVLHPSAKFFSGLEGVDMDTKVYDILKLYADFEFYLDYLPINDASGKFLRNERIVRFSRQIQTATKNNKVENIKVSRSEENLFVWCFFLAVLQMVLDGDAAYSWVKYIYIDDPISSLDENNAIAVANNLAQMLTKTAKLIPTIISSHHTLFFNVLCNEIKKANKYLLKSHEASKTYTVSDTSSKPFLHHLATLVDLGVVKSYGIVKRNHFNQLRCVMEQTAIFHGLDHWSACIRLTESDSDRTFYERMINVMSHADYLINEPEELNAKHQDDFRIIFQKFVDSHLFNPILFDAANSGEAAQGPVAVTNSVIAI
jgi:hypothetical protein